MNLVVKGLLFAGAAALLGGSLATAAGPILELAVSRSVPLAAAVSPTWLTLSAALVATLLAALISALLARRALLPIAGAIEGMQQRLEHRNAALTRAYLTVMESEQRLAGIIDHLIEGFVVVEAGGLIQRANPAAGRIFGYPADELTGLHIDTLGWNEAELDAVSSRPGDRAAGVRATDNQTLLNGRTRSNDALLVEVGVTRVDQDGRVLYCVLVRDLSARLRMEREVRQSREFLNRVVELMPVAVFLKEAATFRFTLVNRAMEVLTGAPREDIIGRRYQDFPHLDRDMVALFTQRERQLADGKGPLETLQYLMRTRAGERTVRSTAVALTDETGRITHLLGVIEDQSQQVAVQNELETARQRAEVANQAKSEFLANMSHELRTPLNAIIGYGEMLDEVARGQHRQQESDDLRRIVDAGRHLLALINLILELAKSESGRTPVFYQPLDVERLVDDVRSVAEPLLESNGNQFVVAGSHTGTCVSDQALLRNILTNLLGNAAKFTRGGRVSLHYEVSGEGARFCVRDTGIGILEEARTRIFQPFAQADTSTSREYGGAGLGLTLCRRYCEQLGGEIAVESEPGLGSVFTVVVPNACSTRPEVASAAES